MTLPPKSALGLCYLVTVMLMTSSFSYCGEIRLEPLRPHDVVSDGAYFAWFLTGSGVVESTKIAALDMDSGRMVIRLNDTLEHLQVESSTWKPQRDTGPRVGDLCEEVWENARIRVSVSYSLQESGEEESVFRGSMKVSAGGKIETFYVDGVTGS